MSKRYQPLANYVAKELSSEGNQYQGIIKIVSSEEQMINVINNQEIDIFFDSPLIGMKIADKTEISPILLSWKEGFREYNSVFIVPIESDITFDNLHGKKIIFEDGESTSGYYLPLIHLKKSGYKIDQNATSDISYAFSLDDENTPIWVLEGRGDVGATSNLDFEDIPTNIKEKLKIIESTEAVPRQIVFIKNDIEFQNTIKKILLEMNESQETIKILKKISKTSQFSEIDVEQDLNQIKELMEMIQQR